MPQNQPSVSIDASHEQSSHTLFALIATINQRCVHQHTGVKKFNRVTFFKDKAISPALVTLLKHLEQISTPALSLQQVMSLLKRTLMYTVGDEKEWLWQVINKIEPKAAPPLTKEIIAPIDAMATSFSEMLIKKNLNIAMLDDRTVTLNDPVEKHAQWAFNHIYSKPYSTTSLTSCSMVQYGGDEGIMAKPQTIARVIHGIMHVSRVAYYIPVIANFYRKYHDPDALRCTDENLKLLQIAALFHDAAREDENVDRWDLQSAWILYHYLTNVLYLDKEKAILYAEAIANKDLDEKGYWALEEQPSGEVWVQKPSLYKKNLFQKLIHDADCLDIIRARDHFDAEYLDLYRDIVQPLRDKTALNEMATLITEVRSLIDKQGDSHFYCNLAVKALYEHEACYLAIESDIKLSQHKMLLYLYASGRLLASESFSKLACVDSTPFDPSAGLTTKNMQALVREGAVLARGIPTPSAARKKQSKTGDFETLAHVELRKIARRKGVPTQSSKSDRMEKEGNPNRSMSMLGYGAVVFANAGFLMIRPDVKKITRVSCHDNDTSFGKKHHLRKLQTLTIEEASEQLAQLQEKLKKGGSSRRYQHEAWRHVEILYHIDEYQAIYFTKDPSLGNMNAYGDSRIAHPNAPLLEAIYLQKEYQQLLGKTLPIFEYSGVHNHISLLPEMSKEELIALWVGMCIDYMKSKLADPYSKEVFLRSAEEIKAKSMYKRLQSKMFYAEENLPADCNYDIALRKEISVQIASARNQLILDYRLAFESELRSGTDVLSDRYFYALIRDPVLILKVEEHIEQAIQVIITQSNATLFSEELLDLRVGNALNFTLRSTIAHVFSDKHFDPYPLIPANQYDKGLVHHSDILRVFALAKKLEHKGAIKVLQKRTLVFIKELIIEARAACASLLDINYCDRSFKRVSFFFKPNETVDDIPQKLLCLINLCATFGVLPEVKQAINELIYEFIRHFSIIVTREKLPDLVLKNYIEFFDYIDDNRLAGPDYEHIVHQALVFITKNQPHIKFKAEYYLSCYLRLARIVGLPEEQCKAVMLKQLVDNGRQFDGEVSVFFNELGNGSLHLDPDVFTAMIKRINLIHGGVYPDNALQLFNDKMVELGYALPDVMLMGFRAWQLTIIKDQLHQTWKAMSMNGWWNFELKPSTSGVLRVLRVIDDYISLNPCIIPITDIPSAKADVEHLLKAVGGEWEKHASKIKKIAAHFGISMESFLSKEEVAVSTPMRLAMF